MRIRLIGTQKGHDMKNGKLNTLCVHAGTYLDEKSLGVNTPVFASTAHLFPNDRDLVRYPRYYNVPTQLAVSEKICALEGGEIGMVFSSGMAAITSVLFAFLKQGDHAVFQSGLYGGTQSFVATEIGNYGIEYDIVTTTNPDDYEKAIKPNTRIIYIESPTNPLLDIIDIKAIAAIGKKHNVLTAIDNTFASPANQQPLSHGIDVTIHSGTKYLNGHSDICCGAVVTSRKLMDQIYKRAINHGGSLDIHACSMLERGLKTLGLRVARQNENAMQIATMLESNAKVRKVNYPGLKSHHGHEVAVGQMDGFGGMVSFDLDCDKKSADRFVAALKIIKGAVSLGGLESILCFPCETSHARLSPEVRQAQGIGDSLIRLSVGIEDAGDLMEDLERGLGVL